MNIFKRAFISTKRRIGKSALLLLLVFILGNLIAGAISVDQTVDNTVEALRAKLIPVASIGSDSNAEYDPDEEWQYITEEVIKNVGGLEYVKYYDYSVETTLETKTLKLGWVYNEYVDEAEIQSFGFKGTQALEPIDFKEGLYSLVDGRVFNESEIKGTEYVAIISKAVAEKNSLHVGSLMDFSDFIIYDDEDESPNELFSYQFEVVGIYEPNEENYKTNITEMSDVLGYELNNTIYAPNKVLEKINEAYMNEMASYYPDSDKFDYTISYSENNLFVLENPDDLEAFTTEASEFLPNGYKIATQSDTYQKVAAPLSSLRDTARMILVIAVGASLLILSLLITLFLRDRKHEIGIYLALGEKKIKIVSQIIAEVLIVGIIAITLSLFTGNIIASSVSDAMIDNEIIAQQAEAEEQGVSYSALDYLGYSSDINENDLTDNYNVSLSFNIIVLFFVVGLGTIVVSTLIPVLYVTRLNPKKILM